jgi:hypothetical protein
MTQRVKEARFNDAGSPYESALRTLRVNYDPGGGTSLPLKKLQARLSVYALRSKSARACPVGERERYRRLNWDYGPMMSEDDIQLDNGFSVDAAIEIYIEDQEPLTILAIAPSLSPGG